MNGRGNRSIRRNPAPMPLCPPQIDMRLLSYHNLITVDRTARRAKKRGENLIFNLKIKQFLNICGSVMIYFIMGWLISLKVSCLLNVHFLVTYIVACLLKARTVKPVETATAREWPCKCHVAAGCCNNRGIKGRGVFCAFHGGAIRIMRTAVFTTV
jgi:hypothetical protein